MMKYFYAFIILSVQLLNAQVSMTDINNITNKQLDAIRAELQQNAQKPVVKNIVETSPEAVSIEVKDQIEKKNLDYFGYGYFQKDISFFDNIPTPKDYKLGPGDEIIISMWGETNYRNNIIINKDGLIYFENIGFINLSNLNIDSAEKLLKKRLSEIYATLISDSDRTYLSLSLGKLKSMNVYFSGQIENPGINLVHPFSDIFTAIMQAGGIERNGSLREVQLIRNNEIIKTIDFYSFFIDGKKDFSTIRILDGDVIHIPKVKRRVAISGAVNRPSYYELLPNELTSDLIDYAVGLTSSASSSLELTQIIPASERISDDFARTKKTISISEKDSIYLNDGDSIGISSIPLVSFSVKVNGRVKSPGQYPAEGAFLKDILDLAGGFNDPTYRKSIDSDKILILRKDPNQYYTEEFIVPYDESENFNLEIDDQIFVYANSFFENSDTFKVEGEVLTPGSFRFTEQITVREAINKAGGFTDIAFTNAVAVTGNFVSSSLQDGSLLSGVTLDTIIGSGAIITVPKRTNVYKVEGNVYSPGNFAYNNNITIKKAITRAGGFRPNTLKQRVYIQRANGKIEKTRGVLSRNMKRLYQGDMLVVPVDPNPSEFNITSFVSDLTVTLTNIAAILILLDNQND